jgi:hypothetical protein
MGKPSEGQQPPETNRVDPVGIFGLPGGDVTDMWSKAMNDLVSSEESFEASAHAFDSYLTMSASAHKLFTRFMGQILGRLNLPTQGEVISVAERLTNIEMRLDDLDARLDQMAHGIEAIARALPAAPPEAGKRASRTKGADRQSSKSVQE